MGNAGWIVLLPMLALLRVINRRANPEGRRAKTVAAVLTMVVAVAAGVGFAYTAPARWTATAIAWAGTPFGADGALGLTIALVVTAVGTAVCDIGFDRVADKGAQFAAIVFPMLILLTVGGAMGHTGGDAVSSSYAQLAAYAHQIGGK